MTRARDVSNTQASSGGPVPSEIAGKNKVINGDFRFNQRNFTSISGSADTFGFDRFKMVSSGGATYTPETFTPGSAPVAGYEAVNYARVVTSGQTGTTPYTLFVTTVEDVRILAGQTATISFWAKSASGTPKIALEIGQGFGAGGSPSSFVNTYIAQSTISTTWTRYSITTTIPSISGKTIGTTPNTSFSVLSFWLSAGTDFNARTGSLGIQSNTFDIWGVQLEAGPVATPFETATGTIQGELAACQRYYIRSTPGTAYAGYGTGMSGSSTSSYVYIPFPVSLRLQPQAVEYSTLAISDGYAYVLAISNLALNHSTPTMAALMATHASGATTARTALICNNNSTSGYIGFTAEL